MSRSTRRPARLSPRRGVLVLTGLSLTACGSTTTRLDDAAGGLDNVTVTGDFGKAPKVEWEGRSTSSDIETEVHHRG